MTGCIPSLCTLLRAPATVMFGQSFMKPVIAVYLVSSSVGGITIYDHLLQEFFSLRFGFFFPRCHLIPSQFSNGECTSQLNVPTGDMSAELSRLFDSALG